VGISTAFVLLRESEKKGEDGATRPLILLDIWKNGASSFRFLSLSSKEWIAMSTPDLLSTATNIFYMLGEGSLPPPPSMTPPVKGLD